MIPTIAMIPFLGKWEMTNDLVGQVDGHVDYMLMYDNDTESNSETVYPWSGAPGVQSIPAPGWNLHTMWNDAMDRTFFAYYPAPANIAILNNDLILDTPDYIEQLATTLRSADSLAMVGGTPYDWEDKENVLPALAGVTHRGEAVMLKAELPFRFDDQFEWWRGDDDMVAQIEDAGYWVGIVPRARHTHIGGGGQTAQDNYGPEFDARVMRDTQRLYAKWPQMQPPNLYLPRETLRPQ